MSLLLRPGHLLLALVLASGHPVATEPPPDQPEHPAGPVESRLKQVAPLPADNVAMERSPGQKRAVVLIHGLGVHPIRKSLVEQAGYRCWQEHDSTLVRQLAPLADVYSLAYSQNAPIERIIDLAGLPAQVA